MSRIRRTDLAFSTLNSTSRVSPDTRTKWAATVAEERANTNARSPPNLPTQSSQSSLVSPDTRIESASVSIERAGPNAGRFHLPTQWSQAWSVDVEAGLRTMLRTSARQEIVLRLRGERAEIMVSIMQLWLDHSPVTNEFRRSVLIHLHKLSFVSDTLPRQLSLKGVQRIDYEPTATGGFSDVFRARWNGQIVAIKRLRVRAEDAAKVNQILRKEALIWRQLRHAHVLPFLGIDEHSFAARGALGLVSPWMKRGTMRAHVRSEQYVATRDRDRLLCDTSRGISYLHDRGVVHRDINWDNIFITDDGLGSAQIADFGLAVIADAATNGMSASSGPRGTVAWMAPERFHITDNTTRFATSVDVYSFGMLCYAMWILERPFAGLYDYAIMNSVTSGRRPPRPSPAQCGGEVLADAYWDLIQRSWAEDSAARPSMKQVYVTFKSWFMRPARAART